MAYAFKLTAKHDFRAGGKVILAKGMSFEHVEQSCSSPNSPNVHKTIKSRFGEDVYISSISLDFDVKKL